MRTSTRMVGIALGCAVAVGSAVPGLAGQTPLAPPHATAAKEKLPSGMAADMAAKCQAMMADHQKMMAEMKAADQRLGDLVAKMHAAAGPGKVDATAAVVSEMVAQRLSMRHGMMKMEHGMMTHTVEHMQAGKDTVASCPMMKSMGGMKD